MQMTRRDFLRTVGATTVILSLGRLGFARAAEEEGFESFWVPDHFFGGEGFPDRDCYDAWTVLAGLARDTKTIRLGCLVTAGLTRVRTFCQDDAHIFCAQDQIRSEVERRCTRPTCCG